MGYRMISADSHIVEPPHIWEKWLSPEFREYAPRLVKDEDGGDAWALGEGAVGRIRSGQSVGMATGTETIALARAMGRRAPAVRCPHLGQLGEASPRVVPGPAGSDLPYLGRSAQ
jgi:hypothetical protein